MNRCLERGAFKAAKDSLEWDRPKEGRAWTDKVKNFFVIRLVIWWCYLSTLPIFFNSKRVK